MALLLSDIVAALTRALDITEGQPPGHAQRTCLIGMRLAQRWGLGGDERSSLFYALLLKDAGCSTNAAQVAALYGADDAVVKRDRKLTNHLRPAESVAHVWRQTAPGEGPAAKVRHLRALVAHGSDGSRALASMRCERGAEIVRMIGLDERAAQAIRHLDEHWDGRGYPDGLAGAAISPLGRVLCLAQTMEVYWQERGPRAACAVAAERAGSWFDPELARIGAGLEHDRELWAALASGGLDSVEPGDRTLLVDEAGLDRIAEAFARIIDAKSPFTARHSEGVAWIGSRLGELLGLDREICTTLRRSGLLHDIGKLGVSNRILDKPGKLNAQEWEEMRRHPGLTFEILDRVPTFRDFAFMAAAHHERLDGSGYHRGILADQLTLPARILAVADVAEALSATRPYRASLGQDEVLAIVRKDAGTRLDAAVVDVLDVALAEWLSLSSPSAVPSQRAA